jgi:Leucine-rich repeat (LRR) protein
MELEELRLENIGLNPTTLAQLESDTSTVDQTKGLTDLFHTEGCPMRKVLKVLNLAGNFLTGSYSSVASGCSGWMFDADCRPLLGLGHALPDTVQRLDLHGCHLGSNAAKTISQWPQLPSLRSLDLSGDNDGGLVGRQEEPDRYLEEWRELCGWLGQQPVINKLSLATNGIGPKALNVFVNHALGRNLRTLSLRGNPLCAGPDAQLDSWAQLCATIARLPLVTLDVADIAPGANDQQRVALLSSLTAALSGDNDSTLYKTLCELDVSSNGLGSAWHSQGDTTAAELVTTEWESFGAALQRCTKLRALRLSSNDIHAFAIRHLMLPSSMNDSAYGLPCFVEALTDLDLGCNPLECGGKLALARVLAQGKLHKLTVHMGASHLVTLEASMTVLDLSSRGLRG